ncbi:MAG TPA: RIP metalloprotease RseP, partial [Pseudomonas sp.]|nr:RIP metalloprotease RseP [Pseudomonas sp.]
ALVFFWALAMLGTEQVRPVVGAVEAGSLAERAGLMAGQEIVEINGKPTSGWAEVNLQLIRRLGESGSLEMLVRADGDQPQRLQLELNDWLKGVEEPDPIGSLGIRPWRPEIAPVVAQLDPEGPAQAAGVRLGDRLVSLDGEPLNEWQEVIDGVRPLGGRSVQLVVERDGQLVELPLTLAERGEGGNRRGYLGAGVAAGEWPSEMLRNVSHGPVEAVGEGLRRTWTMSVLTLDSLRKMLFGELSVKNLSGPITIAKVAGASAQSGVGDFLNFLAYLSISLGVLNLLPIPVLDGGHLLFYLVEWVRGRPLSDRVQGWGVQIGISLVVGVMLLALVNDLGRL